MPCKLNVEMSSQVLLAGIELKALRKENTHQVPWALISLERKGDCHISNHPSTQSPYLPTVEHTINVKGSIP